ncbi:mevalonate kinase [Streptomyces sp. NBC_00237]|uniref:mevalonate kinase n=1 Tax=Streptomyces sp. NBC_00237 TaxID=2975687 RepID=UPI002256C274|nr:mevalonate kinase [Streptomyces sp. NBC_00237]MCX5205735.1 mevalonate kinase [Streptomyces sp. NBC_00237]
MTHDSRESAHDMPALTPIRPPRSNDAADPGGRAHGKVILLGEHAVVYGAPAIALPVPSAQCRALAVPVEGSERGLVSFRVGQYVTSPPASAARAPDIEPPQAFRALVDAALGAAATHQVRGVDLYVESNIPPGRGLGSSAACARAVTEALDQLLQLHLSPSAVYQLVQLAETAAHGRASGIDAHATGSPYPLLFKDGLTSTPTVARQAWVVVADSGTSSSTRQAVEMLAEVFARDPSRRRAFVEHSRTLTEEALDGLATGDVRGVGELLTAAHRRLRTLGLVTEQVHALVKEAQAAGALGGKMTGGGLGGCAIALCDSAAGATAVAVRLRAHGAVRTWIVPLAQGATA